MALLRLPLDYSHPICKEAEQAWAKELENNSKLQQLSDEMLAFFADGFIEGYTSARIKQERQALWTDYENRFEVREEDGDFWIWDYATNGILGGNVFKSELEAEGFKEEFIEYEKQKEHYFNKSGR